MRKMSMDGKRSILKKDGSMSASRGRAVWNETNLAQNEQIKAELNTTKIDEPKTPYHPPIDADLDMEPLDLNNPDAAQQTPPEEGAKACVPTPSAQAEHPQAEGFEIARQEHYSMKDALKMGKALLEEEADDAADEGDGRGERGI